MFEEIRAEIEIIFEQYRKHKYYTLFKKSYETNVTSQIDEVGGGKSNQTSDKVGNAAIKIADQQIAAKEYVESIEQAVSSLPDIERELIELRYMTRNHDYISDYNVYELKMYVSAPYYDKIRRRAFSKLYTMLNSL